MIIRLIFLVLFSICIIQSKEDENPPPVLDLRDFRGVIDGVTINDIDGLLPDKGEGNIALSEDQINQIKEKAKNFIPNPLSENDFIVFKTNFGLMKFKLYSNESPINCLNFKKLANSKFYDKTLFHNVIPRFIVQGGDILSRNYDPDDDGFGGPGWTVVSEVNHLKHQKGTLSMVRSPNDVNSAGSQFFISLSDNKTLDNNYTIIGQLIEGEHVLSRIGKIPSENTQAKLACKVSIPDEEDPKNWVELIDPISKNIIYSKIPNNQDRDIYIEEMNKMLHNLYKPGISIIIDSIRVINEKNINK